jgi:peptidoglycan/xylan/chitin deacetylase (PgdA/CDA1 family)
MRRLKVRRWVVVSAVVLVVVVGAAAGLFALSNARTFQAFGGLTSRVETSEKVVALTFDDGPDPAGAQRILDVLAEHGVPATFYLIGSDLEKHRELGRAIAAAGHEIGNHTYSHERMVLVTPGWVAGEIERTDTLIRATGYGGEITVRPPNGKKLFALPYYLSEHQRKTIMWDVEPNSEPDVDSSASKIVDYSAERVKPGSIVLLHAMYQGRVQSREAVGPLVDRLKAQGYRFVTVSELLRHQGLRYQRK